MISNSNSKNYNISIINIFASADPLIITLSAPLLNMISIKDLDNFERQVSIGVLQGLKVGEEGDTSRAPGRKKLHHHILVLAHNPDPINIYVGKFRNAHLSNCWRVVTVSTVDRLCQSQSNSSSPVEHSLT